MARESAGKCKQKGYQTGLKDAQILSQRNKRYVTAINRPGRRDYREGDPTEGVSVIIDSFRRGAKVEEVVEKLVRQPKQSWSNDRKKAKEYVQRLVAEFRSKVGPYWYGWYLKKEGDTYLLTEAPPAEICHSKFGNLKELEKISPIFRNTYIKAWFDGLLRGIAK